jgi:serine/threonine-protein kinase HipA
MMTSDARYINENAREAFVWTWLPGAAEPVVAGRINIEGSVPQRFVFTYGRSYLERVDAIPLSPLELPLEVGLQEPQGMNVLHSCLRDAGPDAWGRRVLESRYLNLGLNELDYLLLSGSDRIGALDFQRSSNEYIPRGMAHPSLEELLQVAERIEQRLPLPPELDLALLHGSSVGGARPKALIEDNDRQYIAKFSSTTDTYDIVKAEYIAMRLALIAGLDVARVLLTRSLNKDVLLVERFDRDQVQDAISRKLMLSGLSLLGLHEMEARYASYIDLADLVRHRFVDPSNTLHSLFQRLVFNILIGNTDDHARNHAAFWDGKQLCLTPAYDICPQARTGREATQAMQINGVNGNFSTLVNVLSICDRFQLQPDEAKVTIEKMIAVINDNWQTVCDEADLAPLERERLWNRTVLNPFCLEGWK